MPTRNANKYPNQASNIDNSMFLLGPLPELVYGS